MRNIAATFVFVLAVLVTAVPSPAMRDSKVRSIVRRVFPDDQQRALCIVRNESHYDPSAQNGMNTGLFQIDRSTWDPKLNPRALPIVGPIVWARMHEALYNARVARRIYLHDHHGWWQWSTRRLCHA